jgi:hypothetical protein
MANADAIETGKVERWTLVVGVALVAAASLAYHVRASRDLGAHTDELDWSVRSYFYRLAFLERDLHHPLWGDLDGIDQPHVADFLIGAALHASPYPVHEVPDRSASWSGMLLPTGPRLRAARVPGVVLGAAVAPLLVLLGALVAGRAWIGVVVGLLYLAHPLTLQCQPRAMSDAPLQFFSTLAMLILASAYPRLSDPGRRLGPHRGSPLALLIACPILLGLATGTKLTGVFPAAAAVASVFLAAFHAGAGSRSTILPRVGYAYAFAAATALWIVAFNPSLHPDPPGRLSEMIAHRLQVSEGQAEAMPEYALDGPRARAGAFFGRTFGGGISPRSAAVFLGLSTVGLAAAAVDAVRRACRRPLGPTVPLVIWALALAIGLAPSLPLDWDRYYLPFVPPALVLAGLGMTLLTGEAAAARMRWLRWVGLAVAAAAWADASTAPWRSPGPLEWVGVGYQSLREAAEADRLDPAASASLPCPPAFLTLVAPFAAMTPVGGFLAWCAANLALVVVVVSLLARRASGHAAGMLAVASLLAFPVGYGLLVGEPVVLLMGGVGLASGALRRGDDATAGVACMMLWGAPAVAVALGLVFLIMGRRTALIGWGLGAVAIAAAAMLNGPDAWQSTVEQLRASFVPRPVASSSHADETICWYGLLLNVSPGGHQASIRALGLVLSACSLALLPAIWREGLGPDPPRFEARMPATLILALLAGAQHHPQASSALLASVVGLAARDGWPPGWCRLARLGAFGPLTIFYLSGSMRCASLVLTSAMLVGLPFLLAASRGGGRRGTGAGPGDRGAPASSQSPAGDRSLNVSPLGPQEGHHDDRRPC